MQIMPTLSFYEREKIEYYLKLKLKPKQIAKRLRRDKSVVTRELKRNTKPDKTYTAAAAQKLAIYRSHKTNKRKLENDYVLHDYVVRKLRERFSPEQIAGRLKAQPPQELRGRYVNHESIYQYIYDGEGRYEYLYSLLKRKQRKRRKKLGRKPRKNTIPERIFIEDRPRAINERKRFGDWESDLAAFQKQKEGLSVQYERKAMLIRMHKVTDKTASENEQAILQTMESLPKELSKSLTFDNGKENICHVKIRDIFNLDTFFCRPYSAWQKGGVENAIGLIRCYLPKNFNLSTITEEELLRIQESLNNRPRKKLNYLTPNEVISKFIQESTGALNS